MQNAKLSFSKSRKLMSVIVLALFGAAAASAQVVVVGPTPQVGSSNPATAAPTVTRPTTTPCVVTLFSNLEFANFSGKPISYSPPANCPGPWSKVVFTADITVTAGRQFDRTASVYLGNANIYYGTTAEPRSSLSPSWHVERNVTDLSALFASPQSGMANIANFVGVSGGVDYTGIIYATAKLEFYPANPANPAPQVPNVVVPLGSGGLNTGSDTVSQTMTFPKNIDRAYLDVIAQSQGNDEFWYSCAPDSVAGELQNCGGGAFREAEVTIDGKPAGVAPVYPWIYTGGIDPYLWEPIPGIQTLNFVPYRVDLTPFAGVLSDGSQHTVAVSVFGANHYFLATANLLLYTDPGASQVTGGLLSDTLTPPSPQDEANVATPKGNGQMTAAVNTSMARSYTISGYVNTPQGPVTTTVNGSLNFVNNQKYTITNTEYAQSVIQNTNADSTTTTQMGPYVSTKVEHFRYPLTLNSVELVNPDGSVDLTTTVGQGFNKTESTSLNGAGAVTSSVREQDQAADTLLFDSSFNLVGNKNSTATQSYVGRNSLGQCYSRTITASAQVLTSVTDGQGCGK
jgi:hypothetical protein